MIIKGKVEICGPDTIQNTFEDPIDLIKHVVKYREDIIEPRDKNSRYAITIVDAITPI